MLLAFQFGLNYGFKNLFFAALFPKFLNPAAPLMAQYGILTVSFMVIETFWQLIYTGRGRALAAWLSVGKRLMWLNCICGLIFIGLAIGLLWDIVQAALSH